jgi:hypothetical protein
MRTYHTAKSGRKGVPRLDLVWRGQYATGVVRLKGTGNEEDVSAECTTPEEDAWLPRAYEDQGWPQGPQAAASQGAQAAHRLGRSRFRARSGSEALASSRRFSSEGGAWSGRPSLCCGASRRRSGRRASRSAGKSGERSNAIARVGGSERHIGAGPQQIPVIFQWFSWLDHRRWRGPSRALSMLWMR